MKHRELDSDLSPKYKMTKLCSLLREMLLEILAHLPFSDLVSVGRTCAQLWYLTKRPLATRMESSVSTDFRYEPDPGNDYTCYNSGGNLTVFRKRRILDV